MPTNEELENKTNEQANEIEELKTRLETAERLIRLHEHQGLETISLMELIKRIEAVDAKKFKVLGTDPVADDTYSFETAAGKVATMTIKGGIITAITTT